MVIYRLLNVLIVLPISGVLLLINMVLIGVKYISTGKGLLSDEPNELISQLIEHSLGTNSKTK